MKKADKNDSMIIIIIRFGEWLNLGSEGEFVELNGGGRGLKNLGELASSDYPTFGAII